MSDDKRPLRLEYIDAETLDDNPANWRKHPESQMSALSAVLDDVGWAGALLYNERTKRLIDGHARKKLKPGPVPVLIRDWTEEKERKILATLDPLGAMAETDEDKLRELVESVSFDDPKIAAMFDELNPQFDPVSEDEQSRLDQKEPTTCPECGHEWTA